MHPLTFLIPALSIALPSAMAAAADGEQGNPLDPRGGPPYEPRCKFPGDKPGCKNACKGYDRYRCVPICECLDHNDELRYTPPDPTSTWDWIDPPGTPKYWVTSTTSEPTITTDAPTITTPGR
ncbi:hypothetical protein ACJZ2D_000987 [Fusarium nematophilum]